MDDEGHPRLDMASAGQGSLCIPGLRLRGLNVATQVMGICVALGNLLTQGGAWMAGQQGAQGRELAGVHSVGTEETAASEGT